MRLLRRCTDLEAWRHSAGAAPIHFVPTMGALHAGHQSLIARAARPQAGLQPQVLVSVFVNPLQFGAHEDFGRYPRQLERDAELAEAAGAHALFAPSVEELYPAGEHELIRPTRCRRACAAGTARATSTVWPRWWPVSWG